MLTKALFTFPFLVVVIVGSHPCLFSVFIFDLFETYFIKEFDWNTSFIFIQTLKQICQYFFFFLATHTFITTKLPTDFFSSLLSNP